MTLAIETRALTRCFGRHLAVDGVSMTVPDKAVYGFLGRNGAGKTTTLKMLLGLIRPTGGAALVCGVDVTGDRIAASRKVGTLLDANGFYANLTGRENLELTRTLLSFPATEIDRVLEVVKMQVNARRCGSDYSRGMRQPWLGPGHARRGGPHPRGNPPGPARSASGRLRQSAPAERPKTFQTHPIPIISYHVRSRNLQMTNRRNLLIGGAVLSCLGATRAFGQTAQPLLDALDSTQAGAGVPALAGMIVGPDGPTWIGATGLRRKDGDAPVSVEDKWHLGSNTKAMTAALFGRFVDQGRARWGARVVDLLPLGTIAPEWADVTIEAVLAHSAGLLDQTAMGMPWLMTARGDPRPLAEQRLSLAQAMLAVPPAGPAGTFAYANSNYVLIGAIIEHIAGAPWETVMASELFEPLGVTSGGFGAPRGEQPWGHRAGLAINPTSPGSDNPLTMGPAGTVHMTLVDYGRFLRVFLEPGDGWLSSETRSVLTRALGAGAPAYGGGWLIAEGQPWASGPALTHDGSNTMWYVSAWVAPAIGRAFAAVSNDGAGAASCQRLIGQMIAHG